MGAYLIRRLVGLIPVLLLISLVTFLTTALVRGDAASVLLGPTATPERVAEVHKRFGLDQPLPVRYVKWMGQVLQGNLGNSILNKQSVTSLVGNALRVTLQQIVMAMVIAIDEFLSTSRICVVSGGMTMTRACGSTIRRRTLRRLSPLDRPASV